MKKQYLGLIIVISIVSLVLFSFILYNQWPLMVGKKVVLVTQPVDPFDLFRGQYMSINYEISRINGVEGFGKGDSIYIILKEDKQGIWRKEKVSKSKPQAEYFIKGKIAYTYKGGVRVKYGIEQFFFENHAKLPTRNITVEIGVTNSGRAKLSHLLHNGKPIEIEYEKFDIKS